MATYFKYAEREADSYVNWAEIGKSMSDMLKTENQIREDKKSAIDKASREYGEQLANAPQGEHKGLNQWALEYSSDAQQARLMQDKLLKSGQLKLKDYVVMRQNINDGTNQAFDLMKEYNTEYSNKMERMKAEQNQDLEPWLMGEAEGFANFSQTKLYINPTDGTLSVAKMMDGPDGVRTMSNNPNDFTTVNELRNRIKSHFDRFDVAANVGAYVNGLGQEMNVLSDLKNKYQRGTITEILDITDRSFLGNDGDVVMDFVDAETKMLEGMMTNPYNVSSILTNSVNFEQKSGKEYTFTWKEEEAKANPNLILLRNDPKSGLPMPDFSEQQRKDALIYLRTQARLMYDKTEKMTAVGANEKAPTPEWRYVAGKEQEQRDVALKAWRDLQSGTLQEKTASLEYLNGSPFLKQQGLANLRFSQDGTSVEFDYVNPETGQITQVTPKRLLVNSSDIGTALSGKDWMMSGSEAFGNLTPAELKKYSGGTYRFDDRQKGLSSTRTFNMPAVSESGLTPKDLWNNSINSNKDLIEGYVLSSGEEASVLELSRILENSGFSVETSGAGNNIFVTAPDGVTEIEIGTNEGNIAKRASDAAKLMNFLRNNMTDEKANEWSRSGVGSKY